MSKLAAAILALAAIHATSASAQESQDERGNKRKVGELLLKNDCETARIISVADTSYQFYTHVTKWCDHQSWLQNRKAEMFSAKMDDLGAILGGNTSRYRSEVEKTRERLAKDKPTNPLQPSGSEKIQSAFGQAIGQADCAMAMAIAVEAQDSTLASIAKNPCLKLKTKRDKDAHQDR